MPGARNHLAVLADWNTASWRMSIYRARDLARVRVEQRCRKPQFPATGVLACAAQRIGPNGRITEQPRRITL